MKNKHTKLKKFNSTNFSSASSLILKELIETFLNEKDIVNIALSGGNSPLPIYKKLATYNLDWKRINFFLVDERCVEEHSDENNFHNISKVFFDLIPSNCYPIVKDELTQDQNVKRYEEIICQKLERKDDIPQFQLIVLGMGLDGHTASLFPNTKALDNNKDFIVLNEVPQLNTYRITMTYPLILNAEKLVLLIKGEDKIKMYKNASKINLPISKIIPSLDLVLS